VPRGEERKDFVSGVGSVEPGAEEVLLSTSGVEKMSTFRTKLFARAGEGCDP